MDGAVLYTIRRFEQIDEFSQIEGEGNKLLFAYLTSGSVDESEYLGEELASRGIVFENEVDHRVVIRPFNCTRGELLSRVGGLSAERFNELRETPERFGLPLVPPVPVLRGVLSRLDNFIRFERRDYSPMRMAVQGVNPSDLLRVKARPRKCYIR